MYISLHIPKTAGTTLLTYLRKHFKVKEDYELVKCLETKFATNTDYAMSHAECIEAGAIVKLKQVLLPLKYQVIHGHFSANKYSLTPGSKMFTFVRNPAERLLSHYFYWKAIYDIGDRRYKFINEIFEKNFSIDEFIFHPYLRNYQSKYIDGLRIDKFIFVGVADDGYFDLDLRYLFHHILKIPLDDDRIKIENSTNVRYEEIIKCIDMGKLRRHHSDDYELYNLALRNSVIRHKGCGDEPPK